MKRFPSIALNVLTAGSMLSFVVVPLLEGQSPMHIAHTRVWVHQFPDLSIEVPDGSGFRAIIACPGLLAFSVSVFFPCWWIKRHRSRFGYRDAILVALLMMWLPLVSLIDNADEVTDRLVLAVGTFAVLGGGAVLMWAVARGIAYLMAYPQRKRLAFLSCGRCAHCGYDLFGNVSGICPECGCPKAYGG